MISRRKGRSGIISISGADPGPGSGSTTRCAAGCASRPGRDPSRVPAASIARPSRRPGPAGNAGTMGGKKVNGVKRHILVDTLGLVLAVVVHPANIQDRDGAKAVFAKAQLTGPWPRMARVWADEGYAGELIKWVTAFCGRVLEIIKRND